LCRRSDILRREGSILSLRYASGGEDDLDFLPSEGNPTLSLILSKAMLLAEDDRIEDPTILSQLAL
jgi:hypothetical protein